MRSAHTGADCFPDLPLSVADITVGGRLASAQGRHVVIRSTASLV